MVNLPFVFHLVSPVGDAGGGNTSLVCIVLVQGEWGATNVRPTRSVMMIGTGKSHAIQFFSHVCVIGKSAVSVETELMPFGTCAIVRHEYDERVVQFSVLVQFVDNTADVCIHNIHHGCID